MMSDFIKMTMKKSIFFGFVVLIALGASAKNYPKREMRAVWIATVANIDWPSKMDLTAEQQKKEFIELLDLCKDYHMNTVVFQVRPAADAFYASKYEPWSQWLTGQQGKEPEYDPLQFASVECRKRGLDLHVWLNPYRAVSDVKSNKTAPDHITNKHPEWFLTYGKTKYFDPSLPQTRDFVAQVVSDIVRRYDIDGVHMDDYFYPYKIAGVEFPDNESFKNNSRGYADSQKEDWRRDNVDLIIKQIHDSIKAIKPWVEFGISPFGVWRNIAQDPAGSKTKAGVTNYDDLYADILKWQKEKWIDYVTPQIYWEIGKVVADYKILADWWSHNNFGAQLYIGQAPYRISTTAKEKSWQSADEIIRQIKLNRKYPEISGSMFFSAKFMRQNPLGIQEKLQKRYYRYPALAPSNQRISPIAAQLPANARLSSENGKLHLSWDKGENDKNYVIYQFRKWKRVNVENPGNILLTTSDNSVTYTIDKKTNPKRFKYAVTSISKSNAESSPVRFNN
jgi:uncharacterized lipoprotein YddW (UPF0748 family)